MLERVLSRMPVADLMPVIRASVSMIFIVPSRLLGLSISEIRYVTPLFSVGGSFPSASCGHPQVQTVPSSQ